MARRDYGSGSVHQRAQDGRWIGTIEAGYTKTGARRRLTVVAKTKPEAIRKLRDKRQQIEAQGLPSSGARVTVKKWSETWLDMKAEKVRPNSLKALQHAVNGWIIPTIGHRRLDELTPADIRAVRRAFKQAGRADSYAATTHQALMGMLKAAIVEGHQVPQRVLLVEPPTRNLSDRNRMSVEDVVKILGAASQRAQGLRWHFAILRGVRQGEALGLTWPAIDFAAKQLVLEWQLQQVNYAIPGDPSSGFSLPANLPHRHLVRRHHLLPPKSQKGFRLLPLRDAELDALRAWREAQEPNPWGLVWTDVRNNPRDDTDDREEFWSLQDEAGVRHSSGRYYMVHEARHTAATRMQEIGGDEHTIQSQLGHASIVTSRAYMHTNTDAARAMLDRVAESYELD